MSVTPAAQAPSSSETQVKETLISVVIAFILAFVFRAFVIEAFIIPTGSMAPTLMGAHERITSPLTGYTWPVGPWFGGTTNPLPIQGTPSRPMIVHDPMTNGALELQRYGERRQAGDRILVLKYLSSVYDPKRFDVVVFKAPHEPYASVNYIKRLIGLPGDEVALLDGDVFVRLPVPGEKPGPGESWLLDDWKIQRKGEHAQRAVWQPVFSSEFEPLDPVPGFKSPWEGGAGWAIDGRKDYEYSGTGPTTIDWNNRRWPINDFYPYNETSDHRFVPEEIPRQTSVYAVNDIDMFCGVEPRGQSMNASAVLRCRGFEFRADITGRDATLRMGPLTRGADGSEGAPTEWTVLATGALAHAIEPGRITQLEFWHADQALWLFAEGKLVAHGTYDWTPMLRAKYALNLDLKRVIEDDSRTGGSTLALMHTYPQAKLIRWEFSGGPFVLHRAGMQRDLFYQPVSAARAAHPLKRMVLSPDQFFVCGDNSPASLDARLWPPPDPWVAATIDAAEGVVPRNLMIGRAFFVYFPSLVRGQEPAKGGWSPIPMPDFGRMRFIW
jgi:signal peptidase I